MDGRMEVWLNMYPEMPAWHSIGVIAARVGASGAIDNILAVGVPLLKFRDQLASVMTLALEHLSEEAPDVSFVHTCPGVVDSGISRDAEGFGLQVMLLVSSLSKPLIATPPAECGERHVFAATSGVYSPRKTSPNTFAIESDRLSLARGSTREIGSGVYSVGPKSEILPDKALLVLKEFREDGTTERVWRYLMDSFESIIGTPMHASAIISRFGQNTSRGIDHRTAGVVRTVMRPLVCYRVPSTTSSLTYFHTEKWPHD